LKFNIKKIKQKFHYFFWKNKIYEYICNPERNEVLVLNRKENFRQERINFTEESTKIAQVAELVDALVSNTSGATHAGSIPALGTKKSLLIR
jgi:hypothetical protein